LADDYMKKEKTAEEDMESVFLVYKFLNFAPDVLLRGLSMKKEADLKKLFKSVSVLLHPDKNSHP